MRLPARLGAALLLGLPFLVLLILSWIIGTVTTFASNDSVSRPMTFEGLVQWLTFGSLTGTAWLVAVYAWWTRDLGVIAQGQLSEMKSQREESRKPRLGMWSTPHRIDEHREIMVNIANAGPGAVTFARIIARWNGEVYEYVGPLALSASAKERYAVLKPVEMTAPEDEELLASLADQSDCLTYKILCRGIQPFDSMTETDTGSFARAWMAQQGTTFGPDKLERPTFRLRSAYVHPIPGTSVHYPGLQFHNDGRLPALELSGEIAIYEYRPGVKKAPWFFESFGPLTTVGPDAPFAWQGKGEIRWDDRPPINWVEIKWTYANGDQRQFNESEILRWDINELDFRFHSWNSSRFEFE